MAFDGVVISALVKELNDYCIGGRISKIAQPENDELLFTIKTINDGNKRLSISASASLPFLYFTEENKPSPMTAPTFCMVLRKHIAGGRIVSVSQPGLERIIEFRIEHLNEMGDPCKKKLIVELMGKHSNIIFCDEDDTIIDSIKHISAAVSSLREVLPGKKYFIAGTQDQKKNLLEETRPGFADSICSKSGSVYKAIYMLYSGISPCLAQEIAFRAGIDGDASIDSLQGDQVGKLADCALELAKDIKEGDFNPCIVYSGSEPIEYASVELSMYKDLELKRVDSISAVLYSYFHEKELYSRIRQKSSDLRKVIATVLERNVKKLDLQNRQYKDSEKRDKYKLYGELLQVYGYSVQEGAKEVICPNYYDNDKEIKIPLDPTKSALENSARYFDKYGKMKRTAEALTDLIQETSDEIKLLESIQNSLDIAVSVEDLNAIRQEMCDFGFIRKSNKGKQKSAKSKPFHYQSSLGYDIYVGKNNYQNDELTFKFATGNDWWFHAKGIPGSHVIVKANNEELPDLVFEEAAALAGFYSKGRESDKLEIDYLQKKNVKKPNKAVPGFVVYYTNYSMTIHPGTGGVTLIDS